MVPKWILGVVSATGLAGGFALASGASGPPAHGTSAAGEVQHLYRTEVALGTREQELQFLLRLRQQELQPPAAPVTPVAVVATPVSSPPPARPVASPAAPPAGPGDVTPALTASPPPEASPEPTATTTAPVPTTTTTSQPTTTTTTVPSWGDDGSGGTDR
jgi:hypothetical protein